MQGEKTKTVHKPYLNIFDFLSKPQTPQFKTKILKNKILKNNLAQQLNAFPKQANQTLFFQY